MRKTKGARDTVTRSVTGFSLPLPLSFLGQFTSSAEPRIYLYGSNGLPQSELTGGSNAMTSVT
jgi:hypothetical protein